MSSTIAISGRTRNIECLIEFDAPRSTSPRTLPVGLAYVPLTPSHNVLNDETLDPQQSEVRDDAPRARSIAPGWLSPALATKGKTAVAQILVTNLPLATEGDVADCLTNSIRADLGFAVTAKHDGVPILTDLPIIGTLFRKEGNNRVPPP